MNNISRYLLGLLILIVSLACSVGCKKEDRELPIKPKTGLAVAVDKARDVSKISDQRNAVVRKEIETAQEE